MKPYIFESASGFWLWYIHFGKSIQELRLNTKNQLCTVDEFSEVMDDYVPTMVSESWYWLRKGRPEDEKTTVADYLTNKLHSVAIPEPEIQRMYYLIPNYGPQDNPRNFLLSCHDRWELYKPLFMGDKAIMEQRHVFKAVVKLPMVYQNIFTPKLGKDTSLWTYSRVKEVIRDPITIRHVDQLRANFLQNRAASGQQQKPFQKNIRKVDATASSSSPYASNEATVPAVPKYPKSPGFKQGGFKGKPQNFQKGGSFKKPYNKTEGKEKPGPNEVWSEARGLCWTCKDVPGAIARHWKRDCPRGSSAPSSSTPKQPDAASYNPTGRVA